MTTPAVLLPAQQPDQLWCSGYAAMKPQLYTQELAAPLLLGRDGTIGKVQHHTISLAKDKVGGPAYTDNTALATALPQ